MITTQLAVAPQLVGDGVQVQRRGNAIDCLAQRGGRAQRWRQTGVVTTANDDRGAIQRLEAATVRIQLGGREAVVTQAIGTGLDIVDAEYQRVESKNVHGYHSVEIIIGRQAGRPVRGLATARPLDWSAGCWLWGWRDQSRVRMQGIGNRDTCAPAHGAWRWLIGATVGA